MLHSIKLCSDKLNGITTTPLDSVVASAGSSSSPLPAALMVVNPSSTLPTPVAIVNANKNGSVSDNNLNSAIPNISTIVNNSNINSGIVHQQLHKYQGKYLDTASATTKYHPYLRQASVVAGEKLGSPANVAGMSVFAPTLFPAFQNSVSSNCGANKIQPTTTNAAASPSGLLTLPTKHTPYVSTSNSTDAIAFVNSKTACEHNNNYTVLKLKSEIMSEGEDTNDTLHNNKELNSNAESLVESDKSSGLLAPSSINSESVIVDNELNKDQPDPDNIKMFVGQIPKSWDELQLRKMFEQYGRVHTLNVLRDKVTSMSRGCCFVTYYTRKAALKAQDALHNIKTLEGMHHPIQMKPADSENRNERKVFVGMLNKKYNEADVRQLFTGHGNIEECTVLRDQNGQSKGCAFVTFATKHNAIGAIKTLHQSRTMEGCSAPLVVKFADTQKEKDQKKMQQLHHSFVGITALTAPATGTIAGLASTPSSGLSANTALVPSALTAASIRSNSSMSAALAAVSNPQHTAISNHASALLPTSAAMSVPPSLLTAAGSPQQTSPYLTSADAMNASASQLHIFQQLQAFGLHPAQYLQGLNFTPDHSVTTASLSNAGPPAAHATVGAIDAPSQPNNPVGHGLLSTRSISMQNMVTLATLGGHNYSPTQSLQPYSHVVQTPKQHYQQHPGGIPYTSGQSLCAPTHSHEQIILQTKLPMAAPSMAGAPTNTLWSGGESLTSPYASALSPLTNGTSFASATTATALQAAAAGVAGKQVEGPDGSNLFIYHLPQEFTDTDLASTFLPFGSVLSAKVFIDKQTNLSKCFGFVSYDNPHSASAAIQAMHGFQIGTKRLKVQLKRSKDAAKPY